MSEQISLPIAKRLETDVLVVGGGPAGIAAAISAARGGARVLLAERGAMLGGTATQGLVGPFMSCSDKDGRTQIIRGIYREISLEMQRRGGALDPMSCENWSSYSGYYGKGHHACGPFDAECLKLVAEELCVKAGVKLFYGAELIGARSEDRSVKEAYLSTKGGIYAIAARIFIDCTGDADLIVRAGAKWEAAAPSERQASSLFFRIDGIDRETYDSYCRSKMRESGDDHYDKIIAEERAAGRYSGERPRMGTYEAADGSWRVNGTRMCGVDSTDPEAVTDALIRGRQQMKELVDLIRRRLPGCEKARLVESASMLGIRESRRMVGRYRLTGEDLMEARIFPDRVAILSSAVDFHSNTSGKYSASTASHPYTLPLGSLLSVSHDNLMAAGRCLSADQIALSAVRVMPPCFAMGQAVGTAAALSVGRGCAPHELPYACLREALLAADVPLDPEM